MPRILQLIIYPASAALARRPRAHWALFIPLSNNPSLGKVIHAVGTPFTGYGLVFKRNYSLETEDRKYLLLTVGEVDAEHVVDTPGDGSLIEDVEPRDRLEMEAKKVDCPGVSKDPMNPFGGDGCQAWLITYMEWLVQRKIMDERILEVLTNAPKV